MATFNSIRSARITASPDNILSSCFGRQAATTSISNPQELAEIRLAQDFSDIDVKKILVSVPVHKPERQTFIRVRPGDEWRATYHLLNFKEEGAHYLVDPTLGLENEAEATILYTAITRAGEVFLWPIKASTSAWRTNSWALSLHEAAHRAEERWVRVVANRERQAYDIFEAAGSIPEPSWPDFTFDELVKEAFRGRFIKSVDHAVVRRLRGEV